MTTTEQDRAQMEAERNAAEDEYFHNRPHCRNPDRVIGLLSGYERGWNERNKKVLELQARIDALMLEHCPKEVTAEQIAEYAKHQKGIRTLEATWEEPTL